MRVQRQMRDDISTVRLRREFLIVKKDPDVWRATDDDGFYAPEIPASERACHDDQQNDHHRAECAAARLRWRIVAGRGINRRGGGRIAAGHCLSADSTETGFGLELGST